MRRASSKRSDPASRPDLRLVGVAVVDNDAVDVDVVVRHGLHDLARRAVIDQPAGDATPRILGGVSDEGLPLSLHRPQDVAFDPARCMGEALRLAPGQHPTDAIFALDADPLPRRTSPDVLREAIARFPPGAPGDLRAALAASAYGSGARCPDAALPAQVHHPVPAHAEWRWPELPGIDRLQAALHETDRPVDADAR